MEWEAAMANRANSLFSGALDDDAGYTGRRRKKRKKYVDDLINNLLQGGA
jgi:hypothetical protein